MKTQIFENMFTKNADICKFGQCDSLVCGNSRVSNEKQNRIENTLNKPNEKKH